MKRLIPILCVTLSLAACSGPDSSGGTALSKDPHPSTADFPHGSCNSDHKVEQRNTGCGWITGHDKKQYYIEPGADLSGADLRYAVLEEANLSNANFANAQLKYAKFTYARLSGANLAGADGISDLTRANLKDADLHGANLKYTQLSNTDLTNANLSNATVKYTEFSNAKLNGTNLTGVALDVMNKDRLHGVQANSSTICPNGKNWGEPGNNCGFAESNASTICPNGKKWGEPGNNCGSAGRAGVGPNGCVSRDYRYNEALGPIFPVLNPAGLEPAADPRLWDINAITPGPTADPNTCFDNCDCDGARWCQATEKAVMVEGYRVKQGLCVGTAR